MGQMKTEYESGKQGGSKGQAFGELLEKYRKQADLLAEQEERLKEQDARIRELEYKKDQVNRETKSRLFNFIFGREEHKDWTLLLYNAISGSSYTDTKDITINTIEDTVYMGMKNDLSFLVSDTVTMYRSANMYEHQSTYNPNMPVRELIYSGMIYDKYIFMENLRKYGSKLMPLPIPKLVVFYNGERDVEEQVDPKPLGIVQGRDPKEC